MSNQSRFAHGGDCRGWGQVGGNGSLAYMPQPCFLVILMWAALPSLALPAVMG